LRFVELENALCNQDELLCKVFRENKKLNFELKSACSEIASLQSVHDDMSAKPCGRCNMIMVNYADLRLVHFRIANLLDGARLELREIKAHSTLLGACTTCPLLRSDLDAVTIKIKDLKYKLDHSSHYTVLSPPCEAYVSIKGKLFHTIKENTKLQQEVAYLTARLEKIILSEKMIEEDLSIVEESITKSTYRLCVGFERCEDKGKKSTPKFIPISSYHKEEKTIKSTNPVLYPGLTLTPLAPRPRVTKFGGLQKFGWQRTRRIFENLVKTEKVRPKHIWCLEGTWFFWKIEIRPNSPIIWSNSSIIWLNSPTIRPNLSLQLIDRR
jgi:hypothetical protein